MRKPLFYYLAGVLSVIAIIGVLWGFGLILESTFNLGGRGGHYNVTSTSPSPDGKYATTVYSGMGGGAAGWCFKPVTVNPASEPFSIEREKNDGKYLVFNVSCNSEIKAKWESERELLITYGNLHKDESISVYKKPVDWGREVRIRYIEE